MPDTGEAVWAYQWSPHDLWDYDGINEQILLDLPIGGRTRQVLVRPERNGYIYVLDRITGEVLSADPFVHVTATLGIDLKTGRPRENPRKKPALGIVTRDICPAAPGAQGLAAVGVLAAHGPALRARQQPVHGPRGRRGELHRRHAVRRRQRADVRRARAATAAS